MGAADCAERAAGMSSWRPDFLFDGPARARLTVVLAHGAGAPMDTPFMNAWAGAIADLGYRAARFEFPYMAARRHGSRRPPDRAPVLLKCWHQAVTALAPARLVIGGKSMGGRMATMAAAEGTLGKSVAGVLVLGYPFHPPGRPQNLRVEHLHELAVPTLIIQGTRDPMGNADDVAGYGLPKAVTVHWAEDGDHNLSPRKKSGLTAEDNRAAAMKVTARFLRKLAPKPRR